MNFLWIKAKEKYQSRILLKCYKNNIFVYETKNENQLFYFKISQNDYEKLKKIYFAKLEIDSISGVSKLKKDIKKYHIFLIACIFGLITFYCLSHVMVKVEVIHSKKEIRDLITIALEERGIKKNSWKKEYQEIEQIKEEILNLYPSQLEWLEIEVKGMNYIVRVEERKVLEEKSKKTQCNIIANKDGIVKSVLYNQGEALVRTNDFVKKGDILISGTILKDTETKNLVCATGEVFAEVWYKVKVNLPTIEQKKHPTGKIRWNFKWHNEQAEQFIFKSRVENYMEEVHPLFKLFGIEISFVKQIEVEEEQITLNEEELLQKADQLVDEKFKGIFGPKEKILSKKVLKKNLNNSTMELEIFVVCLEQIGKQQEF